MLLLSACGTTPKAPTQTSRPTPPATTSKYYSDDGPPEKVPDNLANVPDAVVTDEPFHRFANRPYVVFGQSYVPVVNKDLTKERGIASWYGRKFHGQRTASGETYDMFAMTAAHKTLPIPSFARVTNVKTGKSVVVRVNDRGPFHSDRIIDLSYAAADRIGIAAAGSGLVEVERILPGKGGSPVAAAPLPPPVMLPSAQDVVSREAAGLWLQLGAFASAEGAESFRGKVLRDLAWLREPATISQREGMHRVRIGPYHDLDQLLAVSEQVRRSLGFDPMMTR